MNREELLQITKDKQIQLLGTYYPSYISLIDEEMEASANNGESYTLISVDKISDKISNNKIPYEIYQIVFKSLYDHYKKEGFYCKIIYPLGGRGREKQLFISWEEVELW